MLSRAIGELLPTALAVALNPFPVIAIVVLLAGAHGRRSGTAFTIGWVVGLSAQMALVLTLTNGTDEADGTSSALFDWLRVVVGVLMIALAVKKWRNRPRPGDEPVLPGWMAALSSATPSRALVVGVALAGANPKNLALTMSAATSITDLVAEGAQSVGAALVFIVLGSASVLCILAYRVVAGSRAVAPLESVQQFMVANSAVMIMLVLLILGAKILGDGLRAVSG